MDARAAKFHCTQAQQKAISTMIKADAAWIAKYNMMDHSLVRVLVAFRYVHLYS